MNARNAAGGITVDLSLLRGVIVDPEQLTAVVQGNNSDAAVLLVILVLHTCCCQQMTFGNDGEAPCTLQETCLLLLP